ncbi:MAG TPA: hypothetical protein VNZ05_09440, partial [Solirubrobacteraceae bacterium]|nr:hypothetical protein [Solirubrobacteraceae bacterium]
RLLRLARAYELASEADTLLAHKDHAGARRLYVQAAELAPEADELTFWAGLGVASDDVAAGVALVRRAAERKPSWLTLLERLPEDLEPAAAPVREALRRAGQEPLP